MIGFFELADPKDYPSAKVLLDEACQFLRESGCTRAIGPLHLNTWLPYRFQTQAPDELRFSWEPSNPVEYPEHWKTYGFKREMLYSSMGHGGLGALVERLKPTWEKALNLGFSFRPLDPEQFLDRELSILHRLSMNGFADNFLFEPLPESLFRELYVPMAGANARQNLALSGYVLSPQNEEVGFAFSFLDSSSRVVLKTATVLKEYRGLGLSNALFYQTLHALDFSVHTEFVSALVREGAQSESYGKKHPLLWRHEYELLSLAL